MIETIISSPITSIILTLLLFFQWYKQHAKEQTVKHNLFALKRMVERAEVLNEKGEDIVDLVDATLATLGARPPFADNLEETIKKVRERLYSEQKKSIRMLERKENKTTDAQ